MQLSARSRTTSSSYSFQPSTDSSTSTSCVGEARRPPRTSPRIPRCCRRCRRRCRPSVKDGRMIAGRPTWSSASMRRLERGDEPAFRRFEADPVHRLAEQLAVLGLGDRLLVGADQLDAVAGERARARQRHRGVERGLPAHRRQQRVDRCRLAGDDALDDLRRDRLDIGRVGQFRIGHDRRRVRIDQHDPVALFAAAPCTPARRNSRTRRPAR